LKQRIESRSRDISEFVKKSEELDISIASSKAQLEASREKIALIEKLSFEKRNRQKELNLEKDRFNDVCTGYMIKLDGFEKEKESLLQKLKEEYDLESDSEEFLSVPEGEASRLGGEVRLIFLRKEIKKLGNVNTDSVEEYRLTKERYDFLKKQYDDIVTSKDELEKLIVSLEKTMREMFISSFEQIRQGFKETFTTLFGGGTADIVLTDKDDILNCGIEINVQPPGKLVKNLTLLSGGEQAFVAIALYFAILKVNPTPFCIFDEIESALDEANIYRYADYLKKNCDKTQFVVITHRRGTMEFADVLYGITMQEKGVSDFIRLDAAGLEMFKTE
jgi:chromosome segregation protein